MCASFERIIFAESHRASHSRIYVRTRMYGQSLNKVHQSIRKELECGANLVIFQSANQVPSYFNMYRNMCVRSIVYVKKINITVNCVHQIYGSLALQSIKFLTYCFAGYLIYDILFLLPHVSDILTSFFLFID